VVAPVHSSSSRPRRDGRCRRCTGSRHGSAPDRYKIYQQMAPPLLRRADLSMTNGVRTYGGGPVEIGISTSGRQRGRLRSAPRSPARERSYGTGPPARRCSLDRGPGRQSLGLRVDDTEPFSIDLVFAQAIERGFKAWESGAWIESRSHSSRQGLTSALHRIPARQRGIPASLHVAPTCRQNKHRG
jgi:hypothetical protein